MRIKEIFEQLFERHGPQGWWPLVELGDLTYKPGCKKYGGYHPKDYSYPKTKLQQFEICTGAILTQNTSWNQASKALLNLYKQNLLNTKSILKATKETLHKIIRPAGYFRQKTKKLKIFSKFFIGLDGKRPTRDQLLNLWGIGPETADSILLYAYKQPEFVVDAYTKRFLLKKGLISEKAKYNEIKALFDDNLKKDYKLFQEYHALIVENAKRK
ncbi:MAG: Endonuclease III [Candidatus Woesearchaeota archaeon]|nr:Endonuclease III [Candidatus Woesearchaeota archaeon]